MLLTRALIWVLAWGSCADFFEGREAAVFMPVRGEFKSLTQSRDRLRERKTSGRNGAAVAWAQAVSARVCRAVAARRVGVARRIFFVPDDGLKLREFADKQAP